MPGSSTPFSQDEEHAAAVAFAEAAREQKKKLEARGVDEGSASSQLMDLLLSSPSAARISLDDDMGGGESHDFVRARLPSCTAEQAAKTLLLREEIARLRGQGNSTATVIQQRRGCGCPSSRKGDHHDDENDGRFSSAHRPPGAHAAPHKRQGSASSTRAGAARSVVFAAAAGRLDGGSLRTPPACATPPRSGGEGTTRGRGSRRSRSPSRATAPSRSSAPGATSRAARGPARCTSRRS